MIEFAPYLEENDRKDLEQCQAFLKDKKVDQGLFAFHPAVTKSDAQFDVAYAPSDSEVVTAVSRFPFGNSRAEIEQWVGDAGWFTCFLLTNKEWAERVKDLTVDSSAQDVCTVFDIDPEDLLRDEIDTESEGSYIAPVDDGFVIYDVEEDGEVTLLGQSKKVAPLIFRLLLEEEILDTPFLDELAEYYPED